MKDELPNAFAWQRTKTMLATISIFIADKIVGGYEENVSILDKHKGFMDAIQYKILQSTPQLLYVHFW